MHLNFWTLWGLTGAALLLSLPVLYWFYRLSGTDLGLHGWKQELLLATGTSAVQAGATRFVGFCYAGPGVFPT